MITTLSEVPSFPIGVLMDKTGRKLMMFITMSINIFCLSSAAFLWHFEIGKSYVTYLNVFFIFFARCSSLLNTNTVIVFLNEYYPTAVRATAYGFARAISRLGGIGATFIWLDLDIVSGLTVLVIFCALSFPSTMILKDTTKKQISNAVDYGDSRKTGISSLIKKQNKKKYVFFSSV